MANGGSRLIIPIFGRLYQAFEPCAYIALRVTSGAMMATFGWSKLFVAGGMARDIALFHQLGIEPRELLARCKSVLRRSVNKSTPSLLERVRMGYHTLDLPKRQLLDQTGGDVALTSGEFDILKTFAENPNRPLSRDWLLETTSHRSRDPFDRAIDLRITRIRRKIEPMPEKPTVIRTVRGVGYMFVPPAE